MKNINLFGAICQTGYGLATTNIAYELSKEAQLYIHPIGRVEIESQKIVERLAPIINKTAEDIFDSKATCVKIWHAHDLKTMIGKGEHIGFPIFELDTFTKQELVQLKSLDRIIVCSDWAKNVIVKHGIDSRNVFVVPLGVDREIFHENVEITNNSFASLKKDTATKFIHIGKAEVRKGLDVLVKIFNKAFNPEDNVKLFLNCHNPFLAQEENQRFSNMYTRSKMGKSVIIVNRLATHSDLAQLMNVVDCGVFPARAEGWNLEFLEMLSCGKMVIGTNNTGHTAYATNDNSLLIETPEMESAYDGHFFFNQGNWYSFDEKEINKAAELMRYVHETKQKGELLENTNGIEAAKRFSWANSARKILEVVDG